MNMHPGAIGIFILLFALHTASAQTNFPAGQLPRDELPKARALDYEFDEVRIATILSWLRRVSVEPPVPLSGTVSGWLWAQAPSSGWWRIGDYRVEGEVTSPQLGVDRLVISKARLRFGYQQGLWTVGSAEGQVATQVVDQPGRDLGQARLSATLPTDTRSLARVQGELAQVQLATLLETLGIEENVPQGQARATFQVESSLANFSSPLTWTGNGHIAADQLQFGSLSDLSVTSDWSLRDAVLNLASTRIALPGPQAQAFTLAASIGLRDRFTWQVQLPTQPVRLNQVFYSSLLPTAITPDNLPSGDLTLAGSSSGTLSPWAAQYALQISSGQLTWLANRFANVNAQLSLGPAGLAIDSLNLQTAGGSVRGGAKFSGQLDEPMHVQMNYEQIDLSTVRAPVELPIMTGRVSGQVKLTLDKHRLSDLESMQAEVRGTGQGVRVSDWGLGNIEYSIDKQANQSDIAIEVQDSGQARRWLAGGQFTPQADKGWRYTVDARGNALDLSIPQLIRLIGTDTPLPVPLETMLVTGNMTFRGDTTRGLDTTEFNFGNITTLERDRRIWSQGSMSGRTNAQFVEIQRSQWKIAGSDLTAALKWHYLRNEQPLPADQVQPLRDYLKLSVNDWQLESLEAWHLISLPKTRDGRRPLQGALSGQVDLARPAGADSWLTDWSGRVNLQLDDLLLNDEAAGQVALDGELSTDQWLGRVSGELLQAPVEGKVKLNLQQQPALTVTSADGELDWTGAEVSQLFALWQSRDQAANWRGAANLRMQFNWNAEGTQRGTAEIDMVQLAYRQRAIVRGLQVAATLENDRVQLVRFDGGVAGGRVDMSGALDLTTRSFEGVVLQLQRVSLEEMFQLFDPDWQQDIKGRADVRARLRLNSVFDVHGDLRLHDASWSEIPIDELHTGFDLTSSADWSIMRLRASGARGRIMGGRATADLQSRLGQRNSVDLRLRIDRGEVEQLSKWTGTSSVVGKGKFDARLNLNSADVRSVRDLRGVLDLSFEDTNARTLPVADQLARFVPLFALPSTEFERGKLSATISRGDLRMRSLALWGRQLSVLGSGNVGISNGRLDMQLVIRTGGGLSQQVASNYLSQLAASSVPPLELILQINRLVANRAIFLRIAGTASQPVIQPQAARMIEQALLRSLLEQAVVLGPAATATATAVNP